MKHTNGLYKGLAVLSLTLILAACGKGKDDNASVGARQARDTAAAAAQNGLGGAQQLGVNAVPADQFQATVAYVTVASQHVSKQYEALQGLVSATMDSQYLGTVNASNGVALQGRVEIDQQGNLSAVNSQIVLKIHDSYSKSGVDGQTFEPYTISIAGGQGTARNYRAELTFGDEFGTIKITGTYDQTNFRGTVEYVNNKTVMSGAARAGGLGSFTVPTCQFFVCY